MCSRPSSIVRMLWIWRIFGMRYDCRWLAGIRTISGNSSTWMNWNFSVVVDNPFSSSLITSFAVLTPWPYRSICRWASHFTNAPRVSEMFFPSFDSKYSQDVDFKLNSLHDCAQPALQNSDRNWLLQPTIRPSLPVVNRVWNFSSGNLKHSLLKRLDLLHVMLLVIADEDDPAFLQNPLHFILDTYWVQRHREFVATICHSLGVSL